MSRRPPAEALDEIRDALRERGYLQGPVQRFVLRDAVLPGSRFVRLSRAAVRGAALGAPLVAALLAWAAALANRPLRGPFDGLVLWLYFLPVAGVALLLADLLAAAAVRLLVRVRGVRRGDSLRAGLLAGAPVLVYLVALWLSRPPEAGPVVDLAFLGLSAVITVAVAWLAGLVSVAGIVRRTGDVPRPAGPVPWAILALASLVAVTAVGVRAAGDEPAPGSAPEFDVAADAAPLVLLGIDGLEARTVEAFEPRGAVDGVLDVMAAGAVFPLGARDEAEPAEVWTTTMTGLGPEVHGVRSVGVERLPGVATPLSSAAGPLPIGAALRWLLPARTAPADATGRTVRTLWEIAALGRATVAVGWWSSWPAPVETDDTAYVVSDRVLAKLLGEAEPDRDTAPGSLFGRLAADFDGDRAALRERFEATAPDDVRGEVRRWLWESYLIDGWNWTVARRLGDAEPEAAVFVYLPGLDILRVRLDGASGGGLVALLSEQAAMEWYVAAVDGIVTEAAAWQSARGGNLVVAADPGRLAGPESEGFLAVSGPGARPACVGPVVGRRDATPIALELLGFPRSLELPGRVPARCLDARVEATVADYGRRPEPDGARPSDWNDEMLERLRSLGYLN